MDNTIVLTSSHQSTTSPLLSACSVINNQTIKHPQGYQQQQTPSKNKSPPSPSFSKQNISTASTLSSLSNSSTASSSTSGPVSASIDNTPGYTSTHTQNRQTKLVDLNTNSNQQPVTSLQIVQSNNPPTNKFPNPNDGLPSIENNDDDEFIVVSRDKKKAKVAKSKVRGEANAPPSPSVLAAAGNNVNNTSSSNTHVSNAPTTSASVNYLMDIDTNAVNGITNQARRYAETRYAFPPFIIKFQQNVAMNSVIKELSKYYSDQYKFTLNLAGHRIKNGKELILFAGNRETFSILYDDQKWPSSINALKFTKISPTHLPPQFSLVIRNVPNGYDMNSFINEMKEDYPDLVDARRILNKNHQPTTLVRVDIRNIEIIDELRGRKFIYLNSARYSVTDYLTPAKVLVCTKCFQIGHFRSSCKSELEYCRICGIGMKDIKQHKEICNKEQCCIRCKGAHDANDVKCPEIKSYRAMLTKSILASTNEPIQMETRPNDTRDNFRYKENDFPSLISQTNQSTTRSMQITELNNQLEGLGANLRRLDEDLNKLIETNKVYYGQLNDIRQMITKQDNLLKLHQIDIMFQHGLTGQFISPICQVMVEIIPKLIQRKVIDDKTLLCPSLNALCEKLSNELPNWTSMYLQNENVKFQLVKEMNSIPNAAQIHNGIHSPGQRSDQIN